VRRPAQNAREGLVLVAVAIEKESTEIMARITENTLICWFGCHTSNRTNRRKPRQHYV